VGAQSHVLSPSSTVASTANGAREPRQVRIDGAEHTVVPKHLRPGLQMLLQAFEYAQDLEHDSWQLSLSWIELRRAGMNTADCRWLICRGWAEMAHELTPQTDGTRCFQYNGRRMFSRRTRFVLTSAGVAMAKSTLGRHEPSSADTLFAAAQIAPRVIPQWNRDCHELRVIGRLVKQFKLPSPNQEKILMALEEEGWPPRIDDPLPPARKIDAKQRLHDTIKNLNRNQKQRLIRFMGDGTGQGVRWEFIVEALTPTNGEEAIRHRAK
jgi:hypothetical protein